MPFPKHTRTGRKIKRRRGREGDRDREEEKERGSKEEHIQATVPMEEEMKEEEVSAGTQEKVSTAGMTGMTGQDGEGQD